MVRISENSVGQFHRYPPVGEDDWRYVFATARVRVLEGTMLSRAVLLDMTNAESFEAALELLSGTEYTVGREAALAAVEKKLLERRSAARELFIELMLDEGLVELLKAREDFANMRLAVRRVVTEKPIGLDYSNEGSVPAEEFEEIFEQENYARFPLYLREAVEQGVLGYYQDKDIRAIDYGIDKAQAEYKLRTACQLGSIFLLSLFKTQIDLINIKTMLRLKMAEREEKNLFLEGGFVDVDKFVQGLLAGYEVIAGLFATTAYSHIIEGGVHYLTSEQSFLKLESLCQEHLTGFLKTTDFITAGHQPVVAYLLRKESEIRTVRMVLTAKKNELDTKLIVDRLAG